MRSLEGLDIRYIGEPMPPPTSEEIDFVESLIGAKLPESYIAFLRFSNGGWPRICAFRDRTIQERWEVNRFFHISADINSTGNVALYYRHRWPDAPREILPIADDGSGNFVCLDLTESGKGRVIVWVHDDPDLPIVEVADSFEEFIDSLTPPPD